ncbi:MAG: NYN domain-containing protein [Leptospirales bacterium]
MGRIILVDGYNVIGSEGRFRKSREVLAHERERLVHLLGKYHSLMDADAQIMVVFDGFAPEREPSRSSKGLSVVFSEEEGSADNVLIRLAMRYREQAIVITSDREVIDRVREEGSRVVGAREFLDRIGERTLYRPAGPKVSPGKPEGDDDDTRGSAPRQGKKKGNPRRLSKKERIRRKTLQNL